MQIQDIPVGTSWACRYTTLQFVDTHGRPYTTAPQLQLGQAHPGEPQLLEGIGVIQTRDLDNRRLLLWDPHRAWNVVVSWDDVRDCEPVEWIDNETA